METRYHTLLTLYDIVKDDPQPTTYLCRPRDILLRQFADWNYINDYLKELEEEKLVVTKQLDSLVISITDAGMEKVALFIKESLSGAV